MYHTLAFQDSEVKAKDANIQNEDTFDIFDPRNPINKRRVEASKQKKRDKKRWWRISDVYSALDWK